jgi:hypothetical protein
MGPRQHRDLHWPEDPGGADSGFKLPAPGPGPAEAQEGCANGPQAPGGRQASASGKGCGPPCTIGIRPETSWMVSKKKKGVSIRGVFHAGRGPSGPSVFYSQLIEVCLRPPTSRVWTLEHQKSHVVPGDGLTQTQLSHLQVLENPAVKAWPMHWNSDME